MTFEVGHLERVNAARRALVEFGVTVADLQDAEKGIRTPTFGEYLPVVIAAAGPGANRTYGTYWARMAILWGGRRLDELLASDIEGMKNVAAATAVPALHPSGAGTPANTSSPRPAPSTTGRSRTV